MTPGDDDLNALLRTRFAAVRDADARQTPPFGEMVARARTALPNAPVAPSEVSVRALAPSRRRWRWALAAAPLALAAGLAVVWLAPNRTPNRAADQEFERAVSDWSRLERDLHAPTDGLLAVPGSEYLRRLPPLGSGAGSYRSPS